MLTANNASVILPPATVPWPNSGALNLTGDYIWVRFVYDDATKKVTTWSSDQRDDVHVVRRADLGHAVPVPAGGLRVGVFAKHDGAADDTVQFDAFNVVAGTDPQTPGDDCGGTGGCPQIDEFNGTALDPKWEIVNPTPVPTSAVANGRLAVPLAPGRSVRGATSTPVTCCSRPSRRARGR